MGTRSVIVMLACTLLSEAWRTTNNLEFTIEDKRTHTRQNYVVQRALDAKTLRDFDDIEPYYDNTFSKDIQLDNFSKRGKMKKSNQALTLPCSCKSESYAVDIGENKYPRFVEYRNCTAGSCSLPYYSCREIKYFIKVLTRNEKQLDLSEKSEDVLFSGKVWFFVEHEINAGCECVKDFIDI